MAKKEKEKKEKVPAWVMDIAQAVEKEGTALDMRAVTLNSSKNGIEYAVTTGSVSLDLITGGGWAPGRAVSVFGPEQSGKSTDAWETLAWNLLRGTVCFIFDAEQALDPDYIDRIIYKITGNTMDDYLGEIDYEEGKVIKPGLLYYFQPNVGEDVFRMFERVLSVIPDVIHSKKKGWCWAYKGKTKKDYKLEPRDIEGAISALIIIDSLPHLVPEAKTEDDTKNPMAALARMLSQELPNACNIVSKKRCTLLYTNQVRNKIGVMFGNPENEMGGNAPKFSSSQRLRFGSVALSNVEKIFKTSGSSDKEDGNDVDVEPSWDNEGIDKYRYAKVKVRKNKLFSPHQTCWVRYRFEASGHPGDGLDESFDVYQYLYMTGQCSKKTGKGLSISLLGISEEKGIPEKLIPYLGDKIGREEKKKKDKKKKSKEKEIASFDRKLTWLEFKELVENPERKHALRSLCTRQIKSGYAFGLYFEMKNEKNKEEE